jgi:hypothetical protein
MFSRYETKLVIQQMQMRSDPNTRYPGRGYRYYVGKPLFRFGEGLSLTNFTTTCTHVIQPTRTTTGGPAIAARSPKGRGDDNGSTNGSTNGGTNGGTNVGTSASKNATVVVQCEVRNVGSLRSGDEAVILFHRPPPATDPAAPPTPIRRVLDFTRVTVGPLVSVGDAPPESNAFIFLFLSHVVTL